MKLLSHINLGSVGHCHAERHDYTKSGACYDMFVFSINVDIYLDVSKAST
jgi:hypothetical protein